MTEQHTVERPRFGNRSSPAGEPHVEIQGLSKTFTGRADPVVRGLDLSIPRGEMFGLLGPSGCGKSTTLNLLGGFLEPSAGTIAIDGAVVNDVPPYRRGVALVFQNYALFPHLTAAENVAFGPRIRRMPKPATREKVAGLLELVGLAGHADAYPGQLSGGQQQRVAIARALAVDPALILLDEPLSNLDARLRADMRVELKRILREAGVTTVLVTHDQSEAFAVCDRVGLMFSGDLVTVGSPERLYRLPVSRQAAEFIGEGTFLPATVEHVGPGTTIKARVTLPDRAIHTDATTTVPGIRPGQEGQVFIRPEYVRSATGDATVSTTVEDVSYLGETVTYRLDARGQQIWYKTLGTGQAHQVGDTLSVTWSGSDAVFLPEEPSVRAGGSSPQESRAS
ncbi:ABC transporter ATP-binding protein [Actinomadura sp. NBRC 104412]|uniref:ABC transporter ATP-binding protein n=1 Tax=Actinomadura sp. NBRC 104412 TaxID=3032203 RepID=UPI00249FCD19|nr:ABC transporter ATP-binding protein [Actinomadura sp. NBRC 104412]GLZ07516.1 ABC transporter ATP-binding protein [Actinomadura sp. NBRC 104412]